MAAHSHTRRRRLAQRQRAAVARQQKRARMRVRRERRALRAQGLLCPQCLARIGSTPTCSVCRLMARLGPPSLQPPMFTVQQQGPHHTTAVTYGNLPPLSSPGLPIGSMGPAARTEWTFRLNHDLFTASAKLLVDNPRACAILDNIADP